MASVRHAVLQKTIGSANLDTLVQNVPLSFLRGGALSWFTGNLNYRRSAGYYWSGYSYSSVNSRNLFFNITYVDPRYYSTHGNGFPLRCLTISFFATREGFLIFTLIDHPF